MKGASWISCPDWLFYCRSSPPKIWHLNTITHFPFKPHIHHSLEEFMMDIRSFGLWVIRGEYLPHRTGLVQKLFFLIQMHLHIHLYICCHSIQYLVFRYWWQSMRRRARLGSFSIFTVCSWLISGHAAVRIGVGPHTGRKLCEFPVSARRMSVAYVLSPWTL